MKQYRKILTVTALLLCVLLLECVGNVLLGQLPTQQLADRWSKEEPYAQISCFFSENAGISKDMILPIEQQIRSALEEASVDADGENGRTWVDAYSTESELTIASDRTSMTARTYGVSQDFFLFHPLTLLSGNYFGAADESNDGVILDENVAWQLFGSYNVAGMTVDIGNSTYVIRGVVRGDHGFFSDAAAEETPTVYVAYDILESQLAEGEILTLDSYELLIADPVSGFGMTTVKNALGLDEGNYDIVENSARNSLVSRLTTLKNFGVRSMNTKAIIYPYWENRARGYEDVLALLLVVEIICLIYPVIFAGQKLHQFWKNKQAIKVWLKDRLISLWKKVWHFLKTFVKRVRKIKAEEA